eukprot:gene15152-16710_t
MLAKSLLAVLAVVLVLAASCVETRSKKDRKSRRNKDQLRLKDGRRIVDPTKSWVNFLQQSSLRRGHSSSSGVWSKILFDLQKKFPPIETLFNTKIVRGPPGPPGPQGPPGPAGAIISEAAMVAEFRNLVKDTAERRAARFAGQPLGLMAAGVPDVISAFFVVLRSNIVIHKKQRKELDYYEVKGSGTFIRGTGVQLRSGRFIAPYTAIYRFQASLQIGRAKDVSLKPRDAISANICINSDCDKNVSLKYRSGLSSNARVFTIHVDGLLYLMAGQYTSIMLINYSGNTIQVHSGSTFSGHLVGA